MGSKKTNNTHNYLGNEQVVYQSDNHHLVLTADSVFSFVKSKTSYRYVRIPLEMISSFEVHRRIKWIYLILFFAAITAWIVGDFVYDNPRFRIFIIKTVVMSILFVTTYKKSLKISSIKGDKIKVLLKDLNGRDVYDLIRQMERLKQAKLSK